MKVEIRENSVLVTREEGDTRYYGGGWGSAESRFLYHLKNKLNEEFGYDLIKKRMWKDMHMVSEHQQYLRTRKKTGDPERDVAIYSGFFQLEDAGLRFTKEGQVSLLLVKDFFNPDQNGN